MSKKWIYLGGLVIVVLIAFFMYRKYSVAPSIKLNELNLSDLEQNPVKMDSFRGKKLIVCFSASWCGNCREELNAISRIKDKELQDVEVVVISDEDFEKVAKFKEKSGYPFVFLKMNKEFPEIGINSIPTTYIVDRGFEIKKETVGYINWEDPSTLEHLKRLME